MVAETPKTVTVGLVVVPQTAPAVLYGLLEVLDSVGTTWEVLTGKPASDVRMKPRILADKQGLLTCGMGAPILPDATFESADRYDVVITSDLLLEPDFDPRGQWPDAARWIRSQYELGAIVASVCTGAVLLAEAGMLDGAEATSHWSAVPVFERFYSGVRLKSERILSAAGSDQRIITAGGSASWAELALYLIARFCGREEAVRASKIFILGDRSEGQLPFAAMTRPQAHADGTIEQCQAWIAEHYETANPVARMIEFSGLTARTFKRRFRVATGYTPIEYVQTLRVEEAKFMLETTGMLTDQVGVSVGYEDPASFRRLFKRLTGVTPAQYRRRFRKLGCLPTPSSKFDG